MGDSLRSHFSNKSALHSFIGEEINFTDTKWL